MTAAPHRFYRDAADQAMEDAANEIAGELAVIEEKVSETEHRAQILRSDVERQEAREMKALQDLKAELAAVKIARQGLRDRETAARQAYSAVIEITDTLARASRAALKELEG